MGPVKVGPAHPLHLTKRFNSCTNSETENTMTTQGIPFAFNKSSEEIYKLRDRFWSKNLNKEQYVLGKLDDLTMVTYDKAHNRLLSGKSMLGSEWSIDPETSR